MTEMHEAAEETPLSVTCRSTTDDKAPVTTERRTGNAIRDEALYQFLTSADEDGFAPSYSDGAKKFNLSRQRVSVLFRREWQNHGDDIEEPIIRDGRPRMSVQRFTAKYTTVIIALQSGMSVPDTARLTTFRRGTVHFVAKRCREYGLLPASQPADHGCSTRHDMCFTANGVLL